MAQEPDIDVGAITEALNNKTDTDAANLTGGGVQLVTSYGFPSSHYDDITLKASGEYYTAPADGWFTLQCYVTANSYSIMMQCNSITTIAPAPTVGNGIATYCPCGKGDQMQLLYDGISSVTLFRFVYAKGSEPQS